MYSVTQRIKKIKQPWGGYIKRTDFYAIELNDGIELNENENVHPCLIGLVVDYMTRFAMNTSLDEAFKISLLGAERIHESDNANKLISQIKGLDDESLICACKLVGYDVCFRADRKHYKPVTEIKPDKKTIENIYLMIQRSVSFWQQYGPIIKDGFTFEGGYTSIVSTGDGDYLTNDTLWDFKVSKEEPKSKYTLQLLMYYIMGIHSVHEEFDSIKKLGIYNPRKNKVYLLNISDIPQNVIDKVSHNVIGYGLTSQEPNVFKKAELKELPLKPSTPSKDIRTTIKSSKETNIKVGDIVSHNKFGNGQVIKIVKFDKTTVVTVKLDNSEEKKILSSYLKIVNKKV